MSGKRYSQLRFHPLTVALFAMFRRASKRVLVELQALACYTLMVAHNLFRASGIPAAGFAPMRLAVVADDTDFETEVKDGVKAIRKKTETLIENYDRLDKDVKKAMEDLTTIKNDSNRLGEFETQLKRVNVLLQQQARSSFGSPYQRLLADDDARARINLAFRSIAEKMGDCSKATVEKTLEFWKGRSLDLTNTPGSTYFQAGFLNELYNTLAEFGAWSTLGVRRMGTKITKMPVKTARPIAYVLKPGNRQMADDANKAGTSVNLEVELIGVMITVYLELLQDAEFDVTADVLDDFIEAFNHRLDYLAFMADGTDDASHGGFTGAFNYWTAVAAASTHTTVETMTYPDFVKALTTVDPIVLKRSARWWTHPTMLARILTVRDDNGRPIFQTALEAPSYGAIGTILGFPVTPLFVGPTTNSAGAKVCAFGDPNGIVVGVRQDFDFQASDDFKFDYNLRAFRGIGRAGVMGRRATSGAILKTAAS